MTTRVLRISSLLALGGLILVYLVGAITVADIAARGSSTGIDGVTIENQSIHVRIMRNQMDCTGPASPDMDETCSVSLLGHVLSVSTKRHALDHFRFSDCVVIFRAETSRCWAKTYTVNGAPYATITGLGLKTDEMQSIHRQYALASRTEESWRDLSVKMAVLLAVSCAIVPVVWLRIDAAKRMMIAAASGSATVAIAYVGSILFLLITGFVD